MIIDHIDKIDKIELYCKGKSYETFSSDSQLVEACVFNLSQMGELVNRLDDDFTENHTSIPWHQIRGLRNGIIHDYEGVNLMLVREIIDTDIEELKCMLSALL